MAEGNLSKRAEKTLARIKDGSFYEVYGTRARLSLDELIDAGLITGAGRAVVIGAYYVPATGYVPMQCERFEGRDGYAEALAREAAPELLEALKEIEAANFPDLWNLDARLTIIEKMQGIASTAIAKAEGRS